ncbi:C-type lectin domain family 14 member A [Siniperca chuatsi]|uniref:C-type lectin domain family 14 member A n=1 Tax=Siniperca chuatsi TaxID=119488 RepID=UPI001CE16263|nr:C-type lectin domain family 14 member A [Siniperca chuatsi]
MASRFCSSWIYLWIVIILFGNISADPASPHRYHVHHTQVSFDRAMEDCSPGILTTLATEQEVADILGLVSESVSPLNQNKFTFWVGLRKVKNECVVPTLPLRGFKWMEDGSEESEVNRWTEEPTHTCTSVRCAALKGELDGSTVTRWGLISVTCKNKYGFICKPRDRPTGETSVTPEPSKPEPRPATRKPEPATPQPKLPTQGPGPETDLKPKTETELQEPDPDPEPAPGLDLDCQHPIIPGARSLSLDPDNSSRIQVECWSPIQLELHCSGRPAVWRLLDDSPADFTTVCQPCEAGFQKDASGNCVDIDECSGGGGAPCRHTCLNTEGSYRCVCSDENEKHHDEDSQACTDMATDGDSGSLSGILIPVLVAVAVLVVLVVVVVVTVKCCLMRRSKKRAMTKAEKMAMKSKDGKDSFETANEKVAT